LKQSLKFTCAFGVFGPTAVPEFDELLAAAIPLAGFTALSWLKRMAPLSLLP
jgi:hypothetical protein